MTRHWDTPAYWARYEADDTLREMPDAEPAALADSLERSAASYDDGAEMAALIVAELRRRAAAGIRFWPGPQPIATARATGEHASIDIAELIDDDIPW